MKNKVNYEIKNVKMKYYNVFFKDNCRNIKVIWKGINRLIGNEFKFNKIIQLDIGDIVNIDFIEISNIFNKYFFKIGFFLVFEIKDIFSNFIDYIIFVGYIFNLVKVLCQEVFNLIWKIFSNKVSGFDNILVCLLKEVFFIVICSLIFIINQLIVIGIFLKVWK